MWINWGNGVFQVGKGTPRKGRRQVAPGQMPASFVLQAIIKHLLCTRLKARNTKNQHVGLRHRGRRANLGGQRGMGFHPVVPSTQLVM